MQNHWPTWRIAAEQSGVDEALRTLYCDLDREIAAKQPVCDQSGRCCKFDTFEHRLYVTGLEIAWFLRHSGPMPQPSSEAVLPLLAQRDACVFQVDHLCTAHTVRPLGCRVFFCQSGTEAWQQDIYEDYLDRLKAIHAAFDLPYRYMEWRSGLDEAKAHE